MSRPTRAVVTFHGIAYEMDLAVVRLALVRRHVAGQFHTMDELSKVAGRSRSTVSRWFAGKSTSLPVALVILETLQIGFDDVYTQCELAADDVRRPRHRRKKSTPSQ